MRITLDLRDLAAGAAFLLEAVDFFPLATDAFLAGVFFAGLAASLPLAGFLALAFPLALALAAAALAALVLF